MTGCWLYLIEHCIKYVSKNAYIQIALTSRPFCPSAFNAFVLITKNLKNFSIAGGIGRVYMFFGTVWISSSTCFVTYILLGVFGVQVTSPIPTLVVMLLIASSMSSQFLSIFSFSTDAILQSFLLDEELKFEGKCRPKTMDEYRRSLIYKVKKSKLAACLGCCCCCCPF